MVDKVVADGATNVEVEARNIAAAQPDAVIVLPQTIPSGGRFAAALHSAGVCAQGISNSVLGVPDAVSKYSQFMEGYLVPRVVFKGRGTGRLPGLAGPYRLHGGVLLRRGA